jgi:threonine dehydrogenase-like Zn-dependent dehydrogenase
VHRYLPRLLEHIRNGDIDPTFVISHRMSLEEAPQAYKMFRSKRDECTKVVLTP